MYFSKAEGGNNAVHYSRDLLSKARTHPATTREDRETEENGKTDTNEQARREKEN